MTRRTLRGVALRRAWMVVAVGIAVLAGSPAAAGEPSPTSDPDYARAMEREHAGDRPVASPAAQVAPSAPVTTREVAYATLDGTAINGFLALPSDGAGPRPGVILIHEWWGLNDNIRSVARQLAAQGYAALAVDLYEGDYAGDRDGASALMQKWMAQRERLDENLRQARAFLASDQKAPRIGTVGWCFGGAWSLRAALLMPDGIDATVIYYGRLVTDEAALEPLQSPILGFFGSEDAGIPLSSVRAFESALEALHKPASIHVYEGAHHAFANPSGTHYDAPAAEDAWKRTLHFFGEQLKP